MSFAIKANAIKIIWWSAYITAILLGLFAGSVIQFQILEHPLLAGSIHFLLLMVCTNALVYALTCRRPNNTINAVLLVFSFITTIFVAFIGWFVYMLLLIILVESLKEKLE